MTRLAAAASAAMAALMLAPAMALAQAPPEVTPNTSITPTKTVTPWIYQMAVGAVILGGLVLIGLLASYLRFSPKFFGREEPSRATHPGARPPLLRRAAPAAVPVGVGASTAVAAPPPRAAPPPPAGPPPPPPAEPPAPAETEAGPPAPSEETSATPAPAPTHGGDAGMDQETFDRVLQEQLAKGMDRRVAEGRARAAAVVAGRKKAQG